MGSGLSDLFFACTTPDTSDVNLARKLHNPATPCGLSIRASVPSSSSPSRPPALHPSFSPPPPAFFLSVPRSLCIALSTSLPPSLPPTHRDIRQGLTGYLDCDTLPVNDELPGVTRDTLLEDRLRPAATSGAAEGAYICTAEQKNKTGT